MIEWVASPSMTIEVPEEHRSFIGSLKARGKKIIITIADVKLSRTLPQNALFHVLVRRLSEASGSDFECMKEYVKSYATSLGYPVRVEQGKIVEYYGEPAGKPSSEANVEELALLIEACHIIANNNGIDLEDK